MKKFVVRREESKNVQRTVRVDRFIDLDLKRIAAEAGVSVPKTIAQILEEWALMHPATFKEYRKNGR